MWSCLKAYKRIEWKPKQDSGFTMGLMNVRWLSTCECRPRLIVSVVIFHCPAHAGATHNSSRLKVRFLFVVVLAQILSVEQVRCAFIVMPARITPVLYADQWPHIGSLTLGCVFRLWDACMEEPESAHCWHTARAILFSAKWVRAQPPKIALTQACALLKDEFLPNSENYCREWEINYE